MTKMSKNAREPRPGSRAQRHCRKTKSLPCSLTGAIPVGATRANTGGGNLHREIER